MTTPQQPNQAEGESRIRPATPADTPAILRLAVDTRMFLPHETGALQEEFGGFHAGQRGAGHSLVVWTQTPDAVVSGVAYLGPNTLSERAWDLWMIAVAPDRQRQGIGGDLLRFTESRVTAGGGHLLIIETSSDARFLPTHAFYIRHGYAEVGRIPGFYGDEESKVIFSKRLSAVVVGLS
ncbi:GNAT family N-acetyltransferase [Deinococcus ruber]|uniref:N-acetyltransferase domain-containing protein n=1 Tax=Deinococcus ruber TaxID=1848197 RepID=A0A918CG96_9DEIO|nr:GNAT family N-acetyltransferase [Deinococcus ruber]GGR22189.1 hypothetical protein GCM10008957_37800 [Deinococcus ruber]